MRWAAKGEPWAWELERGKKTWRVPARGPVMTNNSELMRTLAIAGVGLSYALETLIVDELARGELRVVLEQYAPEVPGLFYITQVVPKSRPHCAHSWKRRAKS